MRAAAFAQAGLMAAAGALAACGEGDEPLIGAVAETDVVDHILVFGVIARIELDLIVVGGIAFDTREAVVRFDGQPGLFSDLAVGQVVLLRGHAAGEGVEGVAETIVVDGLLEGPISAIDREAGTFILLDQVVRTTRSTFFDDPIRFELLEGLEVGDFVEVSGFFDATGIIDATRIDFVPPTHVLDLTGTVSGLDPIRRRFLLSSLLVDFSSAVLRGFPFEGLEEGDRVEVVGELAETGEFLAEGVEFQGDLLSAPGVAQVVLEGPVTGFRSTVDFDVAGFPVTADRLTVFGSGVEASLGLGAEAGVEGTVVDGVLRAIRVDVRPAASLLLSGTVEALDDENRSLQVLGVSVTSDERTRIADESGQAAALNLGFGQLVVGDRVEVRGIESPPGAPAVMGTVIKRVEPNRRRAIRGSVTALEPSMFTILGVTVIATSDTRLTDAEGMPTSLEELRARGGTGRVAVEGTELGTAVLVADRAVVLGDRGGTRR